MVEKTLVAPKVYLQAGAHIGAKFKTKGMKQYIFKKRKDRLKVLDVGTIDERLRIASKFIASFEPAEIAVISQKEYGQTPVKKFAELIGARAFLGRFVPGTFSNPAMKNFFEPKLVIVTDPDIDRQAVKESIKIRAPVVALCSTDSSTDHVDLVIPINNKGRKSLALAYWLLAREVLKHRGVIKDYKEYKEKVEDFEFKIKESSIRADIRREPKRRRKR
jgi:small subunit ribosomal protein S2